jgi:hypothetical protein
MTWEETARNEMARLRTLAVVVAVAGCLHALTGNGWLRMILYFAAGYSYVASLLEWKRKELDD